MRWSIVSTRLCLTLLFVATFLLATCQCAEITFARTDSTRCAEDLEVGPFDLDAESSRIAFSSLHMDLQHTRWMQHFSSGDGVDFTIQWDFDEQMTLAERFNIAYTQSVNVTWTVTVNSTSYAYQGSWWFSNGLETVPDLNETGLGFSYDDGMWGAAPGVVDGNEPVVAERGEISTHYCLGSYTYDRWGHGNCDNTDDDCSNYFYGNSSGSSTSIINRMTIVVNCGDGIVSGNEGCDDNNTASGDGCNSTCVVESGFSCTSASPSVCTAQCGDGLIRGGEKCDDNNSTNNDGCTSCQVDDGYTCSGEPSICARTGGADGNEEDGDGSSAMHLRPLFLVY